MSEPLDALRRAGDRAAARPGLMAYALWRYAELEDLPDEAAVMAWLSGGPADNETYVRLRLCAVPAGADLPAAAGRLALRFGLDHARLVTLARRVGAADAMAGGGSSLLAARREGDDGP